MEYMELTIYPCNMTKKMGRELRRTIRRYICTLYKHSLEDSAWSGLVSFPNDRNIS